jgi:hypothetical protein
MRVFLIPWLLPCLAAAACGDNSHPDAEPVSMRERLSSDTPMYIAAGSSAGAITARLRTGTGWDNGLVDLKLDSGKLIAHASPRGALTLTALEVDLQTITIPASVIGHEAELTRPHLQLTAPTEATTAWTDDNHADATATLALELSWSLTVDGVGLPLGAPSLPPLPVKLTLLGDGDRVTAELRVHAPGEVWSWADLIVLSDLELVVGADTPSL